MQESIYLCVVSSGMTQETAMQAEAQVRDGSVVIPPAIRDALRLRDGDTLVFDAEWDVIRLSVRQRASLQDYVGVCGNDSEGKSIERIVAEERERRGH